MRPPRPADGVQVVILGTVHLDPLCHAALTDELNRMKADNPPPDFIGVESTGLEFFAYVLRQREEFQKWAPKVPSPMPPKLVSRLAPTLFFDIDAHLAIFDGVESLHLDSGRETYLDDLGRSKPMAQFMVGGQGTGWLGSLHEFRYQNGLEGDDGERTVPELSNQTRSASSVIANYFTTPMQWANHVDATRDQVWCERVRKKLRSGSDGFALLIVGNRHGKDTDGSIRQLLRSEGISVRTCDLSVDPPRWH